MFLFQIARPSPRGGRRRGHRRDRRRARSRTRRRIEEPQLFAAMAVKPIDADAVRARREMWGTARASIRLGCWSPALIFLSVPPIYLLDTFVPLMVGGTADRLDRAVQVGQPAELAAETSTRPTTSRAGRWRRSGWRWSRRPTIAHRAQERRALPSGPDAHAARWSSRASGTAARSRSGCRTGGVRSASEVALAGAAPEFEFKARDGRLKAGEGAPDAVAAALKAVPNSTRWNGREGRGRRRRDRGRAARARRAATCCWTCGSPSGSPTRSTE